MEHLQCGNIKYNHLTFTFVEYSTGEGDRGKEKAKNVLDEKKQPPWAISYLENECSFLQEYSLRQFDMKRIRFLETS